MLVRHVWGEQATDDTELRTFIKKLRSKLGGEADLHPYRARGRLPHGHTAQPTSGPWAGTQLRQHFEERLRFLRPGFRYLHWELPGRL